MSEIKIFYKDKEKIKVARSISALKELDKKDIIWIDLLDVSDKTEDTLEGFLKIDIQEDEEMEEIELSSRYIQTDDSIVANSNFLKNNFEMEPVNFILKNGILVKFMPYMLAINVGGRKITFTTVKILIILFCSILTRPKNVSCR